MRTLVTKNNEKFLVVLVVNRAAMPTWPEDWIGKSGLWDHNESIGFLSRRFWENSNNYLTVDGPGDCSEIEEDALFRELVRRSDNLSTFAIWGRSKQKLRKLLRSCPVPSEAYLDNNFGLEYWLSDFDEVYRSGKRWYGVH